MRTKPCDIFHAASDAMFVIDVGGTILECNKSAEKLYGYSSADLADKPFFTLLPKDHVGDYEAIMSAILSGKETPPSVTKRITSKNTIVTVSAAFSPVKRENGEIVSILSIERKLAEVEVMQADREVKALLQRINLTTSAMHLGVWEIGIQNQDLVWDKNMYDLFEIPYGIPVTLEQWQEFIHPEDRSRIIEAYNKTISDKSAEADFSLRIITTKGNEKFLLSKMLLQVDESGAAIKAIGASWDNTEQFISRNALQESERKMRAVMRSTKERIYLLDAEGYITLMNDEAKRIVQKIDPSVSKKVKEGDLLYDAVPPELKDKVSAAIQEALKGELIEYEASTVIGGKEQWFIHNFSPARNEENEINGVAIISLDITKRKQAELKQQALLQRLHLITSAVKLGTFEIDLATLEMTGDENLYKIFGLQPGQAFSREIFSRSLHPRDRERVLANIDQSIMNRQSEVNQEFRINAADGQVKCILNKVLIINGENGSPYKAIGSSWDITEVQKTREALEEFGRRMNALLHSTREGIYLFDNNLRLILINEQGKKFARLRSGKLPVIGQHVSEFTREDEIESVEKILRIVLEGNSYDMERNIPSYDGSHWLHLTYNPVKEKDAIIGVCLVLRDVTELVHSRKKLVAARQRAEESERLQEQFLANMSHEIRTPLNGIVGMSNLLLHTPLNEQQKEFLHSIQYSSDNLLFLINDILDLSKIKSGKFRIESIPMDVYNVVEELTPPFKVKAEEKGLRFSVMMDPSIPATVLGDPHRLMQVINNLLSNAVKFTQNGFVKLEVEMVDKVAEQVLLKFIVTDSGIGIEEHKLEHIFESFAQEGSDTARHFGGTGLGLAITQRLVELQGGSVQVTSGKGKGSRFEVNIPYELTNGKKETPKVAAAIPTVSGKPDFKGKRVLVAEDNEVNQQVMRHLLKDYGVEVTIVPDGRQAVELLESGGQFDLMLLDLRMPVMDGFQTLAAIRQKLKLSIPIIILTASVLRDEKDRCIEMGANDYQPKPFSRPILLQCLQRFLGEELKS